MNKELILSVLNVHSDLKGVLHMKITLPKKEVKDEKTVQKM